MSLRPCVTGCMAKSIYEEENMQYDGEEAITLSSNEVLPSVTSKKHSLLNARLKKYMLNKVLPVVAHIISLLIGLGIIIIMSHFME